jgi:uncharacterized membrane protein YeaQ/YmgE (transglycosylase-associated protein family)
MTTNFAITGLIYILIGFGEALIFHYIFKRKFTGTVWITIFVGIAGSFFGGFIDGFLPAVWFFMFVVNSVNLVPPIVLAFLLLWIFHKISVSQDEY